VLIVHSICQNKPWYVLCFQPDEAIILCFIICCECAAVLNTLTLFIASAATRKASGQYKNARQIVEDLASNSSSSSSMDVFSRFSMNIVKGVYHLYLSCFHTP